MTTDLRDLLNSSVGLEPPAILETVKSLGLTAELDALLAGVSPPLWSPQPGPQTLAFESKADVIGYGGAAGGGKTDLGLGLALLRHRRSIIMRREATQLRAIIDRAREIIGNSSGLNQNTGVWRLPDGRQIEFGGCKDPGDEQKYRGQPHDLYVFDEADQFLEFMVRFISGWLRTTAAGQHCQVLLTFNPPSSADGEWLLAWFAPWIDPKHPRPAAPGELRWYAMVDGRDVERPDGEPFRHGNQTITPMSRTFIPAKLRDNPILAATNYAATLDSLPEPLRSQLKYGDFSVGRRDDTWQVIPSEWVRLAQARWTPKPPADLALSALGVDVARGGQDQTVLSPRYKTWFAPLLKYPGTQTPDGPSVAALVAQAVVSRPKAPVNLDVIGVGASAYDFCRQRRLSVAPINFAVGCDRRDRAGVLEFINLRAWAYWSLRESLDPNGPDPVALPPDKELLADLTAPRWTMTPSGIKVEKKEEIRSRLGRSPDCADAVVLAHLPTVELHVRTAAMRDGREHGNVLDDLPSGVFG